MIAFAEFTKSVRRSPRVPRTPIGVFWIVAGTVTLIPLLPFGALMALWSKLRGRPTSFSDVPISACFLLCVAASKVLAVFWAIAAVFRLLFQHAVTVRLWRRR